MIRIVCLAAALAGLAGCGLIDSEMATVDLDLPEQQVIVDTADWELTDEGQMPAVECAETPHVCANRVDTWCGANDICAASCNGNTCEVNILVSLWHTVDLDAEAPELQQLDGQPLVNVMIDRVAFTVSDNTLNMATRPLTVSIAPEGVISTAGRDAQVIGTIPAIQPGQTIDDVDLELTADGRVTLAERMSTYQVPFNVIVGSTVALRAGDDVPSGRLVAGIRVSAHARTGL
ncbi:MAG TPA: hypothetical protein VK698_35255 [Kofleriaceae bacterium]|nr:hypothetical protein [Kofleriaceae bacterium]